MNDPGREERAELTASLRVLLADLIDYAGLFPPAALAMPAAVENYARYVTGSDKWALGRFVLPASRLTEFEREWRRVNGASCRLSVLLADERDLDAVLAFGALYRGDIIVDCVEKKCASPAAVASYAKALPRDMIGFAELSLDDNDLDHLLAATAEAGLRAKIRTGGVQADLFPPAASIARFLAMCASRRVAFKATAGLHHPVRCFRPLTYEPDSPQGTMHGFLNLFVAATLAWWGSGAPDLEAVLKEESASAFAFSEDAIRWRDRILTIVDIVTVRREFAISFGSCSFEEPLGDLRALGLLP